MTIHTMPTFGLRLQIENIVRKQLIDTILYDNPLNLQSLDEYCKLELIRKETSHQQVVGFSQRA